MEKQRPSFPIVALVNTSNFHNATNAFEVGEFWRWKGSLTHVKCGKYTGIGDEHSRECYLLHYMALKWYFLTFIA